MGVCYTSSLVYGLSLSREDCEVVVESEQFEMQNRYCPKTGNVTHQDKVIVKRAVTKYKFKEFEDEEFDWLLDKLSDHDNLECHWGNDYNYAVIGEKVFKNTGDYKFDCPEEGSVTIESLYDVHESVKDAFAEIGVNLEDEDLELHSVMNVG